MKNNLKNSEKNAHLENNIFKTILDICQVFLEYDLFWHIQNSKVFLSQRAKKSLQEVKKHQKNSIKNQTKNEVIR